MWVQLRTTQHVDDRGKTVTRYPGDWVDVGKQQAALWIANGAACIPTMDRAKIALTGSGVVVCGERSAAMTGSAVEVARKYFEPVGKLDFYAATSPELRFERTLLWDMQTKIRAELVPVGFNLLDKWELAAPILSYDTLACNVGDEAERERTKRIIRDLRVPLYHTGLMFIRRTADTARLLQTWETEGKDGANRELAFLRALYRVKPRVLALPITWHDTEGRK